MSNDEHEFDLYWHALNYRTAPAREAEAMWVELQECVRRLKQRRAELVAERCAEYIEQMLGHVGKEMAGKVREWNGKLQQAEQDEDQELK